MFDVTWSIKYCLFKIWIKRRCRILIQYSFYTEISLRPVQSRFCNYNSCNYNRKIIFLNKEIKGFANNFFKLNTRFYGPEINKFVVYCQMSCLIFCPSGKRTKEKYIKILMKTYHHLHDNVFPPPMCC